MKTTMKFTWFAVLGIAAGCAIQKIQRVKSDRLVRQAAGEGAYERSHPKPHEHAQPADVALAG